MFYCKFYFTCDRSFFAPTFIPVKIVLGTPLLLGLLLSACHIKQWDLVLLLEAVAMS